MALSTVSTLNSFKISNPFPGLRSFEEDEHILFFGRENQVDDLISKLRKNRFLAVIGTSGSGKSSLVKSGLLPSLYGGFMAQRGSTWKTVTMRPGNNPIGNLAKSLATENEDFLSQLGIDGTDYSDIVEAGLRRTENGLIEFYEQNIGQSGENLLILIDQFEEIFRFSKFEKENKGFSDSVAFINLLLKANERRDLPVFVVLTMRSDFLGDCTNFKGLPEAINDGHYLIPRMTREEVRQVITGPIAVGGAEIEPALVNRLLNDLGDNPDQLPILQHALMRIWDYWREQGANGALNVEQYEAIGTLKSALSQHAEEAYDELNADQQVLCKSIFKTLTDRSTDNRGIRRPTQVKEVETLTGTSIQQITDVVDVFRKQGRAFLTPDIGTIIDSNSILDISHESFMRVWVRLQAWVDEENEAIQMYLRLTEAAEQYENRRGGLWRNPELSLAIKWKNDNNPNELWASRINNEFARTMLFLEYSIAEQQREEEYKEFQQKARLKRARIFAITVGSVALVAVSMALWANTARKQATIAQKGMAVEKKKADDRLVDLNKAMIKVEASKAELEKKGEDLKVALNESKENYKKALAATDQALAEKERANQEKIQAQIARNDADLARVKAEKAELIAKTEKEKTEQLKTLSDADAKALAAASKFAQNEYEQSLELAKSAYEINKKMGGSESKNSIINALYLGWTHKMQRKNELLSHKAAVKMASLSDKYCLSVDEARMAVVSKIENGAITAIGSTQLPKNVAGLRLVNQSKEAVVVFNDGQFSLYSVNNGKLNFKQNIFKDTRPTSRAIIQEQGGNLFVSNGSHIWAFQNFKGTPKFIKDVKLFYISPKGKVLTCNNSNQISCFNSVAEFENSGKAAWRKEFTENITALSINQTESGYVLGTNNGKMIIGNLQDGDLMKVNGIKENDFPRLHLSRISEIMWVNNLNHDETIISAGYDHTLRMITMKDVRSGNVSSDALRLDIHKSWIYGMEWISTDNDQAGVLSWSEDKVLKYSLLSSEGLSKALN